MTEREKEIRERITREFEVCDRHIIRIKEALDELSAILPIQCDKYQTLTSDEVRCLDQFIFYDKYIVMRSAIIPSVKK